MNIFILRGNFLFWVVSQNQDCYYIELIPVGIQNQIQVYHAVVTNGLPNLFFTPVLFGLVSVYFVLRLPCKGRQSCCHLKDLFHLHSKRRAHQMTRLRGACPKAFQILLIFSCGVSSLGIPPLPLLHVSLTALPFLPCEVTRWQWDRIRRFLGVHREKGGGADRQTELRATWTYSTRAALSTNSSSRPTKWLLPAFLSFSNAILSATLFFHFIWKARSSLSCLNYLLLPHDAILSSKSQTVWFVTLFQVQCGCWVLSDWPCG